MKRYTYVIKSSDHLSGLTTALLSFFLERLTLPAFVQCTFSVEALKQHLIQRMVDSPYIHDVHTITT